MKKNKKRGSGVREKPEPDVDSDDLGLSDEDTYTDKDKMLLERHRKNIQKKKEDSEEEMLGFDESEEDEASDGGLPDIRAWGQHKKSYYSTDYVDQDYGGVGAQEEEDVDMEETEARSIQTRLAEQLKDADFSLDVFTTTKKADDEPIPEDKKIKEKITKDLSKLSKRQQLELLQKESPEFAGLIESFKEYVNKLQEQLEPLLALVNDGSIPPCPAAEFVKTYHEMVLNYCSNLSFYLLLKSKHVSVSSHPVVHRIVQYRQLLTELEQTMPQEMNQQMETILQLASDQPQTMEITDSKSRLLKLLSVTTPISEESEINDNEDVKVPLDNRIKLTRRSDDESSSQGDSEDEQEEELGKRGITYQIAKNKGLTPYRKKELRNPRVKHRMKFRKAKIRRKGQVREVRPELQKYGGEMSGIKMAVSKSVKIK